MIHPDHVVPLALYVVQTHEELTGKRLGCRPLHYRQWQEMYLPVRQEPTWSRSSCAGTGLMEDQASEELVSERQAQ